MILGLKSHREEGEIKEEAGLDSNTFPPQVSPALIQTSCPVQVEAIILML